MRLIDADALLENYDLKNAVKYGNKSAEQRDKSYSTLMMYEIADMIDDAPTIESPRPDWTPCAETTSDPTTGEIVRALRCVADATECKDCRYKYPVGNVILCDHEQMNGNAADCLESQERAIAALTDRAESAERERDAAYSNHPWVRIEGRDYFVQVKRFDPANNMVVIADHKFGWNSVRYDQIREWRGLQPQEGGEIE